MHKKKSVFKNMTFCLSMILVLGFASSFSKATNQSTLPNYCKNPLEYAYGYNAFVRNATTVNGGDAEGPMATGGDLVLDGNFTVSSHTAGNNFFNEDQHATALLVNDKVVYKSGESFYVNHGYVKVGSLLGSKVFDIDRNNAQSNTRITSGDYESIPRVQVQRMQPLVSVNKNDLIDFDYAFFELEEQSNRLSQLQANVTISKYQKISLDLNAVNVLNVTGSELKSLPYLTFENQPNQNTPLVINVNASGVFDWNVFNMNAVGDHHGAFIIWNFYNSSKIILRGGGTLVGSVLAPKSILFKESSGNINGQVVALEYRHKGGELHQHIFDSCTVQETCEVVVVDQQICEGATAILTAVGSGSVLWSTGETTKSIEVSPLETTTYSVTVTNVGCSATTEAVVTVIDPKVSVGDDVTICLGDSVTITATEADSYLWSTGETTQSITVSPTINNTWYKVTATIGGCTVTDMMDVFVRECEPVVVEPSKPISPIIPIDPIDEPRFSFRTTLDTSNYVTSSIIQNSKDLTLRVSKGDDQLAFVESLQIYGVNGVLINVISEDHIFENSNAVNVDLSYLKSELDPGVYIVRFILNGFNRFERFIIN
ncbi:choice-of-anchor A family protein [Aquimarina agarivorans]|uniref:choice-of-anchor A family protein n=1 Tax=Aquimarina agarivorans TaxID=980584 RepID=UPI001300C235|nr:choice-of-anchor A family protein [Aquimarina agarivorans]